MRRRLALFLSMLVALFVGVVPLRECFAADAGRVGVVVLGSHAHPAASAPTGHDHGCCHRSHDDDAPADADCCADAPFHATATLSYISADRALDAASAHRTLHGAGALLPIALLGGRAALVPGGGSLRPPLPAPIRDPIPSGLVSTVLLR